MDTKSSLANAGAFGGFTHEDSDHSTPIDVREILRRLCSEQWDIHAKDVEASHRWLESFMAGVEEAVSGKGKRSVSVFFSSFSLKSLTLCSFFAINDHRPAVAELMKTPGRKRVLPLSNHSIRNDPFATVLFPAATNPSAPIARVSPSKSNNENRAATPRSASRNVFSPTATTSGLRGVPSPRSPVKSGLRKSPTKLNIAETAAEIEKIVNVEPELPAIEAPVALDGAGEDVGAAMVALPLSEEIPAAAEEIVEQLKTEIAAPLPGDDKCDLSMIGEEEEDGDDQARERSKSPLKNNISLPSSTRPSLDSPRTSTSTIPQPFVDALENPKTSYTLPLNDDPRPAVPSSSAVNATTRTPGNASTTSIELPTTGASSRFGTQPQSAKTGHPSSSPPSSLFASARLPTNLGASTSLATLSSGAPTGSFAGVTRASGASVGGRLNFVGLPSLRDREGFSAASLGAGGLLGRAGSLGGAVQSGFRPTLSTNATTLKRKSINGTDEANKIGRVNEATSGEELRSRASQGGQQLGRSERMESLKSKLQSMGGGRLPPSPVAAAASTRNTLGGAIHSSIPSAPLPLPIPHLDSPRLVAHAAAALSPLIKSPLNKLVRQNSVTELVSSFEKYPDDRIPSPSKLPTSVKASVSHFNHLSPVVSPRSPKRVPTASLARAMSPSPLSPTRMTLRSPKAVPALPLSPRNGKQSQRIFEQAAAAQVSTTPKGSPTKPVVVERDEARSILQQMEIADEDDTEEILLPASTATKNTQQLADANLLADDAEEDVTALLPPLPARLEQNSPDDELSMNGEVVVERDRGGLAGEFEIRLVDDEEEEIVSAVKTVVVKASPVKVTLPGSLPTDDVDASFEMIQPFFNVCSAPPPSNQRLIYFLIDSANKRRWSEWQDGIEEELARQSQFRVVFAERHLVVHEQVRKERRESRSQEYSTRCRCGQEGEPTFISHARATADVAMHHRTHKSENEKLISRRRTRNDERSRFRRKLTRINARSRRSATSSGRSAKRLLPNWPPRV